MSEENKKKRAATNKRESHGGNKGNYTLCIDTLALTMVPEEKGRVFDYNALSKEYGSNTDNAYAIGADYLLMHSVENDSSYRYSFNVFCHGEKVANIHLNSKKGKREHIKIDFECHVFYQAEGWFGHYLMIKRLMRLKVNNVSVIHIALDSQGGSYNWHMDKYRQSHWVLGEGHKDIRYAPLTKALYTLTGTELIVGQVRSGKRVACYRKCVEIDVSGKWYIRDFHKSNGLDMSKPVDRVEVRLTNQWLKNFDFDLEELNIQEGLERLFLAAVKDIGFWDLATNEKSRDTDYKLKYNKVYLINPAMFDARPMAKVKKCNLENADGYSVWSLRKTFKDLLFTYIKHGKAQDLFYLRYYVSSPSNWVELNNSRHNGLIGLTEINRDIYRHLAKRYTKEYGKKGESLSEKVSERKDRVESRLFCPLPTPIIVESQGKKVKVLSPCVAMYSPYLFVPPEV